MHLIIPMSGQGERFRRDGYSVPKPLIPVGDEPMITRALEAFPIDWPVTFVLAESHRDSELPALLLKLRPKGTTIFIADHREGPGRALQGALPTLPIDEPVLVSYCDYGMNWDAMEFSHFVAQSGCDACVICYRGYHPHLLNPAPYARVRLEHERVVEVREKGDFGGDAGSEWTSSGGYYFKSARLLGQALDQQMQRGLLLGGESYTSLTVQALLEARPEADVRIFPIPAFFQWGTPADVRAFSFWERSCLAWKRFGGQLGAVDQLVMPMAGRGSRLTASVGHVPKPLVKIEGTPLFVRALQSLPTAAKRIFVPLKSFAKDLSPWLRSDDLVVALEQTPQGAAHTTAAALTSLGDGDLVVSACDHAMAMNPAQFKAFRARPDCDAAIFTMRGLPSADQRPTSFAYVQTDVNSHEDFPQVVAVSVKTPLSNRPSDDQVLIGTFWFRDRSVLARGLELLFAKDRRVGGEVHLDLIFEALIDDGRRVRAIPVEAFFNWGDPDSLAETVAWCDLFSGRPVAQQGWARGSA